MNWPTERVATLTKLWLDGLSGSQIAKQLGGTTRNAVIGKVHRLGLAGREAPSRRRLAPDSGAPPSRPKPLKPEIIRIVRPRGRPRKVSPEPKPEVTASQVRPVSPVLSELSGTATILTLEGRMCKWPIGDPGTQDFSFCGRQASDGGSYCTDHARVAYAPQRGKRKTSAAELTRSLRDYV